jgi:hypothetical protein
MTELVHFHVHRTTGGEKREEGGRQREGFHKKDSVRNGNKTSKEDGTDRRKVNRWDGWKNKRKEEEKKGRDLGREDSR